MDWCRACGGRLTPEDRLCPWCRAPLPAPSRDPAAASTRDRLPDSAPYSLDELEDDIPILDEPPAFARPRGERAERSSGDSLRPRPPSDRRTAARERTSATQATASAAQ